MRDNDPNLPGLRAVARALGEELCARVVFVGGSTAGLLLTDPAAESVRATLDVDAIVMADSLSHYHRIEAEVAARGFVRDVQSEVICRWRHRNSGVPFDLMPVNPAILGFSNRWYADAIRTAVPVALEAGLQIRLVTAPAFVATKLEAFTDRGRGDLLSSHDLEDVLNVVDGRPELSQELDAAPAALRDAVRAAFAALLRNPDFDNGLPGMIADPDRAGIVWERLRVMSA